MKKLISAEDITQCHKNGLDTLYVTKKTIVTDLARDLAEEYGVSIEVKEVADKQEVTTEDLILLLKEVLAIGVPSDPFKAVIDPSGTTVINGDSVQLEQVSNRQDVSVLKRELVNDKSIKLGFLTFNGKNCPHQTSQEEVYYVMNGCFNMTINEKEYAVKQGDVVVIPKQTLVTWTSSEDVNLLYVNY
jgi:ethanolamine utilization protein EutQ